MSGGGRGGGRELGTMQHLFPTAKGNSALFAHFLYFLQEQDVARETLHGLDEERAKIVALGFRHLLDTLHS